MATGGQFADQVGEGTAVRVSAGFGAQAADTFMSHLAMLEALPGGGDPTTWLEPLTDEQYQKANRPGS